MKTFNLSSNYILIECLKHLKVIGEYNIDFFYEDSVSVEGEIIPLSIEINFCLSKVEFVEVREEGIDP